MNKLSRALNLAAFALAATFALPAAAQQVALAQAATTTTSVKVVSRVEPEFPREAIQAGADKGVVKARLTLDAGGKVTSVEIVDAVPRRLFDRSVKQALAQWQFSDGAAGRTVETDVEFKR